MQCGGTSTTSQRTTGPILKRDPVTIYSGYGGIFRVFDLDLLTIGTRLIILYIFLAIEFFSSNNSFSFKTWFGSKLGKFVLDKSDNLHPLFFFEQIKSTHDPGHILSVLRSVHFPAKSFSEISKILNSSTVTVRLLYHRLNTVNCKTL